MYPLVELQIKNNVPKIVYYSEEDKSKQISLESENLLDSVIFAGKDLALIAPEAESTLENFENLLQLARESDESFIQDLPPLNDEVVEFELLKTLKPYLESIKSIQTDEYQDLNMTEEVRAELEKFKNADIFASFMEALYSILIAKTLLAASELGIGNIRLDDDFRNPRLLEKMSKELDKLGIELLIPEIL